VDQFGKVKNKRHLQLAGAFRELADQIERLPDHGDFEHVERALGSFADARDVSFRYAPNPLEPDRRFLELKVWTADGKRWRSRWIKQGTKQHVAAFLRHFRTPHTVWTNAGDMARKLASGNEFS
jgi:hypothetical protein